MKALRWIFLLTMFGGFLGAVLELSAGTFSGELAESFHIEGWEERPDAFAWASPSFQVRADENPFRILMATEESGLEKLSGLLISFRATDDKGRILARGEKKILPGTSKKGWNTPWSRAWTYELADGVIFSPGTYQISVQISDVMKKTPGPLSASLNLQLYARTAEPNRRLGMLYATMVLIGGIGAILTRPKSLRA